MWNPFIPNLETCLFTQGTGTGQAVCLISWWCLSLIHVHLQVAGCDVYPGIIVNFLTCLNLRTEAETVARGSLESLAGIEGIYAVAAKYVPFLKEDHRGIVT